jgi:hypothetical protein
MREDELSPQWPEDLIAKYPLTFRLIRDFGCGSGWRQLLTDLCEVIEPIIAAMPHDDEDLIVSAVQVKEKFGGLRFYMSCSVPEIDQAIRGAEALAERTCERCGAPGVLDSDTQYSWVNVRCSACREGSRAERTAMEIAAEERQKKKP